MFTFVDVFYTTQCKKYVFFFPPGFNHNGGTWILLLDGLYLRVQYYTEQDLHL